MTRHIPRPNNTTSLRALRAMIRERNPLAALEVFFREMGNVFYAPLPGFKPIMLAGPEACHFLLVEAREHFLWRSENDPITRLLGHGLLVEDGETHDHMRQGMHPALHKKALVGYVEAMWQATDQIAADWAGPRDMLVEIRRIALLIIMQTMFRVDFTPDLDRLWQSVLAMLRFVSPGLWLFWPGVPRPGVRQAIDQMDQYLHEIIRYRRTLPEQPDDLLGLLIHMGASDSMVRDQMQTMIVAGHDTSTAAIAWALYLLGQHPDAMQRVREEVGAALNGQPPTMEKLPELPYLGAVIDEALRLYPPAHLGSRIAAQDLEFQGYTIPKGQRVTYSIYCTQRMAEYWENPATFRPERFLPPNKPVPYSFLPFGGGPRNCIGTAFAQVEMKVVLARMLQRFDLRALPGKVHAHMAVTLEPRPGVLMDVRRRE